MRGAIYESIPSLVYIYIYISVKMVLYSRGVWNALFSLAVY